MPRDPGIQYVGFAGHANLGDDAIREALRVSLAPAELIDMPVGRRALARSGASYARRARGLPALLGGGTVLGRRLWRYQLTAADAFFSPSAWALVGAGVEDLDFRGDRTYTSADELNKWRAHLSRFGKVTVRGPRSRELLASIGVAAEVVGDPALLLEAPVTDARYVNYDLLINASSGEDQWGGRNNNWTNHIVAAIWPLVLQNLRVGFLEMEPSDKAFNHEIARGLGVEYVPEKPRDVLELRTCLHAAGAVLSSRLHANIVASAVGTPNIALEYRPKCRDFMLSIGREEYCHRVDSLDAGLIRDHVTYMLSSRNEEVAYLEGVVSGYRAKLRGEITRLKRVLALE